MVTIISKLLTEHKWTPKHYRLSGFILPNSQQMYHPRTYVLQRRHISYDAC